MKATEKSLLQLAKIFQFRSWIVGIADDFSTKATQPVFARTGNAPVYFFLKTLSIDRIQTGIRKRSLFRCLQCR